ncbi:MAG: type II secretion system minor pseudopilin GspK [Pseudomonas sp.]|uniref:type II secretion system minor pseudopilin GspK n=1 Tax=Pseudomonas sp. TaxID=306 RepID=UPI003396457F
MNGRQRGVALITVLLVVAIVTVVCAGLIARQQLAIRASSNQAQARQAYQYALGGEALAQGILTRDLKTPSAGGSDSEGSADEAGGGVTGGLGAQVDHLQEAWAKPLPTFPIDEGAITVRIEDLSGRFNLNSLVKTRAAGQPQIDPDNPGGAKANGKAKVRFERLLTFLEIKNNGYADRLIDWLDTQPERTGDNGAEDNEYLLADPPYRAGNRRLEDVSELRLLLGMKDEDYRRLLPYVAVLPADAKLNINTASAMVLASYVDGLDPARAQALVQGRPPAGYRTVQEFKSRIPGGGATPPSTPTGDGLAPDDGLGTAPGGGDGSGGGSGDEGLGVSSQYFQVISEVRVGDRRQVLVSTLQRQAASRDGRAASVRVLQRNLGQSVRLTPAAARDDKG